MKKKKEIKKDEVSEIFKIEDGGKEKIIKTHIMKEEKEEKPSKEQINKENKIFRNIILVLAGFILMFLIVYLIIYYINHFEVEGVKFEIVKMGSLTLYKTSVPVMYQGKKADYNFYLRTNPKLLKNTEFNGDLSVKENMVINMSEDFNCNGDGVIAIANLLNLYKLIGTNVIKDENAGCDDIYGRYVFLNIKNGDETRIVEYGLKGACYNLNVNNCEILKVTEKFMLESFIKINKLKKE